MFTKHRTEGVILKRKDAGDFDKILSIYTEKFGKLSVFAKSVKKPASKLRFGTESFSLIEIEFIEGKARKTLTDIRVLVSYPGIRKSMPCSAFLSKGLDVLDLLVREGERSGALWISLNAFLENLNGTGSSLAYHRFVWNLFALAGYAPELDSCVLCSGKSPFYFSADDGGAICATCASGKSEPLAINEEILGIMKSFFGNGSVKMEISSGNEKVLMLLSEKYLKCIESG